MRKFLAMLVAVVSVVLSAAFVSACGAGGKNSEGDASGATHSVTVRESDLYDVSVVGEAKAGETVRAEVSVDARFGNVARVSAVYANGSACTSEGNGRYAFVMPDGDVTLTVKTEGVEVKETDNGMTWINCPAYVSPMAENETARYQRFDMDFGTETVTGRTDENGCLTAVGVYSTDESVIPSSAIAGAIAYGDASAVKTAYFDVDRSQIREGATTLIVLDDDSDRAVSINVTVAPFGQANGGLWDVSVSVDAGEVGAEAKDGGYRLVLTQTSYYVYGCGYEEEQWESVVCPSDSIQTISFKYDPTALYTLSFRYLSAGEGGEYVNMPIGGGVSGGIGNYEYPVAFSENNGVLEIEI